MAGYKHSWLKKKHTQKKPHKKTQLSVERNMYLSGKSIIKNIDETAVIIDQKLSL